MQKHKDSHMDHGFNADQWAYIFERFAGRDAFFIETIELPENLGTVTNELYGPSAGDAPVTDEEIVWGKRGDREWDSRLVLKPKRPTRFVRVIAGPHEETCPRCQGSGYFYGLAIPPDNGPFPCDCVKGKIQHKCILYTAYGVPSIDAPQSPKETGDLVRPLQKLLGERSQLEHAMLTGVAKRDEAEKRLAELHDTIEKAQKAYLDAADFWKVHALAAPLSMYPCKDCGAPRMGDAYYDAYPGEDPRRCQTCGTL